MLDLNETSLFKTVMEIIIGRLEMKIKELISEKSPVLMTPNREKPKINAAMGIEINFLNVNKIPTAKKIDAINISFCKESEILHCSSLVYVILFIVGNIVSLKKVRVKMA